MACILLNADAESSSKHVLYIVSSHRDKQVDVILERSHLLQQELTNFVLDADDGLAKALEIYTAEKSKSGSRDSFHKDYIIDSFITQGRLGNFSVLDLFIHTHPQLTNEERQLIKNWHRTFTGLFAIQSILPDGFEFMNWLTTKRYIVKLNNDRVKKDTLRLREGEIILTRIAPVTETYWTFSGFYKLMGKLGKPKLAVALGNFKENYKDQLYADAPELLEEAWRSVEYYHQQFVEFFGSDEVTMPGYRLNQKNADFQEILAQTHLKAAGIDSSKSLGEIAKEAGIDEEEIKKVTQDLGAGLNTVTQMFNPQKSFSKMVIPKVDLPTELKKAEQLTALSHPHWGQIFLPTYAKIKAILVAEDWQRIEGAKKLIYFYLEDESINASIWYRLAQQYPTQLEKVLQRVLQRPKFCLQTDLDALLVEFDKLLKPELPEIASVPIHLHNLFQEVVVDMSKSKPKGKHQKSAKGFQRL